MGHIQIWYDHNIRKSAFLHLNHMNIFLISKGKSILYILSMPNQSRDVKIKKNSLDVK